ncbi:class I SAM-dependent methyltransferase [Granulicella arctica]|uniref:class I SAM-dependent methyltransferase n=1 Tax=Granulicella arctica TaxID=940613 RepID=UPI0021E0E90A|nr:class I SAM-dependent methyltransferase [Granulicella arctica]
MTTLQLIPSLSNPATSLSGQPVLLCCRCSSVLTTLDATTSTSCSHCNAETLCDKGIWRSLSPKQSQLFEPFIRDYEFIRAAEGRASDDPAYYLALPYEDRSGRMPGQWMIRARTFRNIERCILTRLASHQVRPLRILDLGAGNGWLSYRLSLLGHVPVAVDLLTNDDDGLGAASHYAANLATMFPRVQASLNQLPFADATFDLAIFNASFHYAENYTKTLAEALRCTRRGGAVVIADTPWYKLEESGRKMVEEKHNHFRATYGIASDSRPSLEFLTPERLRDMAATLGITWQVYKPYYGLNWALRPVRARLRNRRTPSQFRIYMAEVTS